MAQVGINADLRYTPPVQVSELFMSRRLAWTPEPAVHLPWATIRLCSEQMFQKPKNDRHRSGLRWE